MPTRLPPHRVALVTLASFTAVSLVLVGCGADGPARSRPEATALPPPPDPGFGHVHGLGLNPGDGVVYVATHFGVFRLPEPGAGGPPARVADRWQDTMGFTVAGPDLFYGSGHPDLREGGPPHLGFIVSRDRAETWEPVALRGAADFHDLAVAGPRVYGYDSTGQLLRVSDDEGRTWEDRPPRPVRDVTVDPDEPDRVLATTPDGLLVSDDAARSFRAVVDGPRLLVVDWSPRVLAGVDPSGTVWVAEHLGGPWQQRGRLSGSPQAFDAADDGRLFGADDEGVKVSDDEGRTWTLLAAYDDAEGH